MKKRTLIMFVIILSITFSALLVISALKTVRESHHIIASPAIENAGLILPTIGGDWDGDKLIIYHQGDRRLVPATIERWKKLEGVIDVQEQDYSVTITRSPNFEWNDIFPPLKKTN